jgi:hypothetical protein
MRLHDSVAHLSGVISTSTAIDYIKFVTYIISRFRQSQWQSGLRRVLSSAARTLGSQVRILLGAWMFVCVFLCCVVL